MNRRKMLKTGAGLLSAGVLATGVASGFSGSGSGTQSDPYQITSVEELQEIQNELTAYYELANDIDASGYSFSPIGTDTNGFEGVLEGNGNTITGLTISSNQGWVGMFSSIKNDGVVRNFTVEEGDVTGTSGATRTGGICGGLESGSSTIIENVEYNGTVESSDSTGGIVGYLGFGLNPGVRDCVVNADIVGTQNVGGIVGDTGYIETSEFSGTVTGDSNVGGISGGTADGITECYSEGEIIATGNGDDARMGGINGYNSFGAIESSYSIMDITGSGSTGSIGSIVGRLGGTIGTSFGAGSLSGGGSDVNGDIGLNDGATVNSGVYWDTEATGAASGSGTGLTTSEMTGSAAETNMSALDFSNVWATRDGDYPKFQWQSFVPPSFEALFYNPETLITNKHSGETNMITDTSRDPTDKDKDISDQVRITIRQGS